MANSLKACLFNLRSCDIYKAWYQLLPDQPIYVYDTVALCLLGVSRAHILRPWPAHTYNNKPVT